ncbi:MAG: DNA mismatch repair protein MutS [Tannerella sp.]|jgi:hypothetical protein|nr:DNA mismatch repair protein MutS [Tannerella sp.]
MEALIDFYKTRIETCSGTLERLKKRIYLLGTLRLLVFGGAIVLLWLFRDAGWPALTGIAAVMAIPFATLVVVHSNLFRQKTYTEAMIRLNVGEQRAIDYDFEAFDGVPEEVDAQHSFSTDLDLFGEQSLFQSLNRTVTCVGKSLLASWFKQPLTDKSAILKRQEAVKEMARKTTFRQHFCVTGIPERAGKDDMRKLNELFSRTTRFSQRLFWRLTIWIIPALWLVTLAGTLWGGFPGSVSGVMFVAAYFVSNMQSRRIHLLHKSADEMEKILQTYSQLIEQIEKESFHSEELAETQQAFVLEKGNASQVIRRLSRIIGELDQRFSLVGFLLNLFCMRDMRQAMNLEQWITAHAGDSAKWFDALARIDAFCSLGGFAFNHPDYVYPDISDRYFEMEGKALGHPLLHRDKCVKNDVSISRSSYFLIITGANMAGKSTYLRTVGINFLLACVGLPVCADSLTVYPAHPVTSLRTADSLTAHESYFFAELKRLKMIIDRLHAGEELFIVLDEILKGTNSKDKQKGSFALMKQLIALRSCGIIATHDLLLGTLENDFPANTKNLCFEADIDGDRLTFTYRLRRGVAQNMNASFLMKKMGITL